MKGYVLYLRHGIDMPVILASAYLSLRESVPCLMRNVIDSWHWLDIDS